MMSHNEVHAVIPSDQPDAGSGQFIGRAKALMKKLVWLSPAPSLGSTTSSAFGRNIERELNGRLRNEGVMTLMLRKRASAVVMSIKHYEEVLKMKEACEQLLEAETQHLIEDAANDFDQLYSRIASTPSRKAADHLFAVSPEELRNTYRPGDTEKAE